MDANAKETSQRLVSSFSIKTHSFPSACQLSIDTGHFSGHSQSSKIVSAIVSWGELVQVQERVRKREAAAARSIKFDKPAFMIYHKEELELCFDSEVLQLLQLYNGDHV